MGKIFVACVLCFTVIYGLSLVQKVANQPAKQPIVNFVTTVSNPEKSARRQYGEYGRKFTGNQKTDFPLLRHQTPYISNSNTLSSPYGAHGNNFSLYDINSPGGQWGKL